MQLVLFVWYMVHYQAYNKFFISYNNTVNINYNRKLS